MVTMRIRRCANSVYEFHVAYVVEIYLVLQYNNHTLPVQLYREDCCRKGKLADCRIPLSSVSFTATDETAVMSLEIPM